MSGDYGTVSLIKFPDRRFKVENLIENRQVFDSMHYVSWNRADCIAP